MNLEGRDPFGSAKPGNEQARLLEEICAELLDMWQPGSGEPIVARVTLTEERFGPNAHPDPPLLTVQFRADLVPLESCQSDRVGRITAPFGKALNSRTADHTTNALFVARGPQIPSGGRLPEANLLDVGPTVLSVLGVPVPNSLDGRPFLEPVTRVA